MANGSCQCLCLWTLCNTATLPSKESNYRNKGRLFCRGETAIIPSASQLEVSLIVDSSLSCCIASIYIHLQHSLSAYIVQIIEAKTKETHLVMWEPVKANHQNFANPAGRPCSSCTIVAGWYSQLYQPKCKFITYNQDPAYLFSRITNTTRKHPSWSTSEDQRDQPICWVTQTRPWQHTANSIALQPRLQNPVLASFRYKTGAMNSHHS